MDIQLEVVNFRGVLLSDYLKNKIIFGDNPLFSTVINHYNFMKQLTNLNKLSPSLNTNARFGIFF